MNKNNLTKAAALAGVLLGAFAITALADWSNPTSTPPNCDTGDTSCASPINASATFQQKAGPLQINGDFSAMGKLFLASTGATAGQVLTLKDAGTGETQWTSVSGGTSSPIPNGLTAYTTAGTYTWTAPAGVTRVRVRVWGGGGGGGGNHAGSGGGGGGYAESIVNVTAGTSYTVVVGSGGNWIGSIPAGESNFQVSGSPVVRAYGGSNGAANGTTAAAGGDGVGTIVMKGQPGGFGSAGTNSDVQYAPGGNSPEGGFGSQQVLQSQSIGNDSTYTSPTAPGGGGAGSSDGNVNVKGAAGEVIIEY